MSSPMNFDLALLALIVAPVSGVCVRGLDQACGFERICQEDARRPSVDLCYGGWRVLWITWCHNRHPCAIGGMGSGFAHGGLNHLQP